MSPDTATSQPAHRQPPSPPSPDSPDSRAEHHVEILGTRSVEDDACGCGCSHGESAQPVPSAAESPAAVATDLDVRALPHGARHEIIFTALDRLEPGQALVIVNDHDPKPLRYQTSAMWPDRFVWRYLESGPVVWRVAIIHAD